MADDDNTPITVGQAKGCFKGAAGIIGGLVLLGGLAYGVLYLLACANMPTGCH